MSTSTWPEDCPHCGAAWKVRSKTMGAAHGQPHQGRCVNGHWWTETAPPVPPSITGILTRVDRRPQRQDSLNDQLSDLVQVANHLGMYDAADFITRQLSTPTPERTS